MTEDLTVLATVLGQAASTANAVSRALDQLDTLIADRAADMARPIVAAAERAAAATGAEMAYALQRKNDLIAELQRQNEALLERAGRAEADAWRTAAASVLDDNARQLVRISQGDIHTVLYLECSECEDRIVGLDPGDELEDLLRSVSNHYALYHTGDADRD